jgi:hypothetical protein
MPPITRWFIKAGIFWFVTGVILAFIAQLPVLSTGSLLLPVYWHMLVIGWITQIIMGVSIWMFPRKKRDRLKNQSGFTVASFLLLNSGLVIRFLSEPFLPVLQEDPIVIVSVVISSLLQVSGILFYTADIWPRLQPKLSQKKKLSGVH